MILKTHVGVQLKASRSLRTYLIEPVGMKTMLFLRHRHRHQIGRGCPILAVCGVHGSLSKLLLQCLPLPRQLTPNRVARNDLPTVPIHRFICTCIYLDIPQTPQIYNMGLSSPLTGSKHVKPYVIYPIAMVHIWDPRSFHHSRLGRWPGAPVTSAREDS